MKKILCLLLCLCVLLACTLGCQPDIPEPPSGGGGEQQQPNDTPEDTPEDTPPTEENPYKNYLEYLKDPDFKTGFIVSSPINGSGISDTGTLSITEGAEPLWHLAQWGSDHDIMLNADSLPVNGLNGNKIFFSKHVNGTPAKRVTVREDGSVTLELNASLEYDEPRKPDETWPHLLLSQDWNKSLLWVPFAKDIRLMMEFSLDKFVDHMGSSANRNMHAAQFIWYVTLQNRNTGSAGYGEYLWFGLNLFDNRMDFPSFYAAHDNGTSAFIYQPDAHDFRSEPVTVGSTVCIDFPLLSHAKTAFNLAKERGYLKNTAWQDLYIGSMNTGFEIPGTYDIAVTIRDISIKYKY